MILNYLIDEDFTARSFENVKSLHHLVQYLEREYSKEIETFRRPGGYKEFVIDMVRIFFKYRNKPAELNEIARQISQGITRGG